MDTEEVYPTPDESSQECGNSPPSSQMEFQTINMSHGNTLKHSSEDKDEAEINAEPPAKIPRLTYEQETEHVGCADSGGSSVADSKDDDDGDMVDSPSSEKNMCPLPLHIEDEERMEKYGTHEFEIIDEVAADDDGKEENEQDSDDSLDDSELYALLEEGITKDSISGLQKPIEREKVVLVGKMQFKTVKSVFFLNFAHCIVDSPPGTISKLKSHVYFFTYCFLSFTKRKISLQY